MDGEHEAVGGAVTDPRPWVDRAGQAPVLLVQALRYCTRCAVGFIVGMGWGCGDPEPSWKEGAGCTEPHEPLVYLSRGPAGQSSKGTGEYSVLYLYPAGSRQ